MSCILLTDLRKSTCRGKCFFDVFDDSLEKRGL